MSNKKNQHYVPQFCLRNFSSDSSKVINLYNLESKKIIKNAAIKHQACKDYFYSKDTTIETFLAEFERRTSEIFIKILKELKLPLKRSEDYFRVLLFISIQYSRTQFARDDILGINHQMVSILGEEFKHFSISKDNWINIKLNPALLCTDALRDLKMKLISNKTSTEFIFSDNPVVFYNQFLEMKGRSEIGYSSIGLEIFFPLSPLLCLIIYDSHTYHIGKAQSDLIEIFDYKDIHSINNLQVLSATSNLYFSKTFNQEFIGNALKYKRNHMTTVTEYHSLTNNDSIMATNTSPISCNLQLSFMKLTKKARRYKYDASKVFHPRYQYVL